eukprot:Tamp_10431.p2 GENE.Tamp_10431~~Tamp_10431.p2  ORF type:complete len:274 (-),score=67.39 Tamp_10431:1216-2007(-)
MGIRDEAKLCFQKGKFGAAAEAYTEAITQEPGNAALYQNRALCYQKLCKWTNVVEDAGKALELAGDSVKAHYLLANAHLNLEHLDEAEASFQAALSLANTPEAAGYRVSVEQGLYSLYATRRNEELARIESEDAENRSIVDEMLEEAYAMAASMGHEAEAASTHAERTQKVAELYDRIAQSRERPSVPEALCCQITFDIMRDPVQTPAGHTYEREAIAQHIQHNGPWDPVTRQPLQRSQIVKNHALLSVIDEFLKRNPWAYGK